MLWYPTDTDIYVIKDTYTVPIIIMYYLTPELWTPPVYKGRNVIPKCPGGSTVSAWENLPVSSTKGGWIEPVVDSKVPSVLLV